MTTASQAKDLTLQEIRDELLGKEVIVLGGEFPSARLPPKLARLDPTAGKLTDWYLVKGNDASGYTKSTPYVYAPVEMRGQRGVGVSVDEALSVLGTTAKGQVDAFGKPLGAGKITNPYFNVVVRMPTGELIGNTGYYTTMMGHSIQSATRADAQKREIGQYLESLQGKTLYKAGYTEVIQSDIALQDLLDRNKRALERNRAVANLSPLKVLETRHLEAENAVVLKVSLPDGGEGLLFGDLQFYDQQYAEPPTMLYRVGILAGEQKPAKFSAKELAAIKESTVFRGMSEDALYWSWGYPEMTNNWGSSGKQHVYSGSQYVYVQGKKVTDSQSLR